MDVPVSGEGVCVGVPLVSPGDVAGSGLELVVSSGHSVRHVPSAHRFMSSDSDPEVVPVSASARRLLPELDSVELVVPLAVSSLVSDSDPMFWQPAIANASAAASGSQCRVFI
ncbi:MAG TPA: hypothetical protein VIL32_00355 [Steroidobacteraceae bacterium]